MALRDEQALLVAPTWMVSDTEESIVGTEWHQEAIGALATMVRDVADRRGAAWGVCEQIELTGLRRRDGRSYSPRPDVMVLARPLDGNRAAIHISEAGAPLFILEVASKTTIRNDLEGKRDVYAAIGVPEYLIFDPSGDIIGDAVQAWRLAPASSTVYQPWAPNDDGYWHSSALDIAFWPEQPFLMVRDHDGLLIPHPRTAARRLRDEQAARQQLEEELRRLRVQYQD